MGVGSLTRKRAKRAIVASQKTLRSLTLSQGRLRCFARLAQIAFGFAQARLSLGRERFLATDKPLLPCARGAPATRGEGGGAELTQVVYVPLKLPLDSARHAPGTGRGYSYSHRMPNK